MPITLAILYRTRQLLFTALALLMTVMIWLLLTDLMIRNPIGAFMLRYLSLWYGFWPMFAHGIRGAMGVYPETVQAHWTITLSGLTLFFITQFLLLGPGKNWRKRLIHRTPASSCVHIMAGLPAAMITVSIMATLLETMGLWKYLPGEIFHSWGCVWLPQTLVLWFTMLISWSAWSLIFQQMFRKGDRFMQLAGIIYTLFVASSVSMGLASAVQIYQVGFISQYYLSGSYTGMMLSGWVMLWTLMPALVLIYAAKSYSSQRIDMIRHGDKVGMQWFKISSANTPAVITHALP